ncbi:MAG: hypothetical protein U9Q20_06515 [Campylobacterota bacterium]|nr:hypothetical protein [Campylobacterota bacterium]
MKNIFKGLVYILFFFIVFILFLPKENIYYFALDKLKDEKIVLDHHNIKDEYFTLNVNNLSLKYDNIKVSTAKELKFDLFLYKTQFTLNKIDVDSSFSKFVPNKIESISVTHNILDPLFLNIESKFELGFAKGYIDILNNTISIEISVDKKFKTKYRYAIKQLKLIKDKSNEKEEVYSFEFKY